MNVLSTVYVFLLFLLLTPGLLINLPFKMSKMVRTLAHATIFTVIWQFTNQYVLDMTNKLFEGFGVEKVENTAKAAKDAAAKAGPTKAGAKADDKKAADKKADDKKTADKKAADKKADDKKAADKKAADKKTADAAKAAAAAVTAPPLLKR